MVCNPKDSIGGYICPIRGCKKRKTTLYSITGLVAHMQSYHTGEIEKRLKLKKGYKLNREIQVSK